MIFNCHNRKKRRTTALGPALQAIHVHNHLPGSSAQFDLGGSGQGDSPLIQSTPLPTTVKRSQSTPFQKSPGPQPIIDLTMSDPVIDLTNFDSDDDGDIRDIRYPRIHDMLVELHSELPELRVMAYEHILAEDGFFCVDQLVDNDVESHMRNELLIPFGVVIQFRRWAERLMRRTEKLKREE